MINNGYFKSKPIKVRLEASTICQLNCSLCPTGNKSDMRTGKGFLKFSDFKNFIDTNDFIRSIELSNFGEIFLNPDLGEIIKYACTKKVDLAASNGANLNSISEEMCEILVKYGFKSITCSIDGASQDVYRIYRKGGNFDKVIENIKMINKYKKIYRSKFPFLNWQFVVFEHNAHEIKKARKMARRLGMVFKTKPPWNPSSLPAQDGAVVKKRPGIVKKILSIKAQLFNYNLHKYQICTQLWNLPQVNWDGKLLGCCSNCWGNYGNVFESGLKEAFNNEKIRYARKMLLGLAEERKEMPCCKCDIYKELKHNRDSLTPFDIKISGYIVYRRNLFALKLLFCLTELYGTVRRIFRKRILHNH